MKAELHLLTPVHVGSGTKYTQMEMIEEITKVHRIPLEVYDQLFKELEQNNPTANLADILADVSVYEEFKREHRTRILETQQQSYQMRKFPSSSKQIPFMISEDDEVKEISEFIKTPAGAWYIPGSSIKGAILSAFIYHCLKKSNINPDLGKKVKKMLTTFIHPQNRKERRKVYPRLLNIAFSEFYRKFTRNTVPTSKNINRFAPWLQVSDCTPIFNENRDAYLILQDHVKGSRRTMMQFLEALNMDLSTTLNISFSPLPSHSITLTPRDFLRIIDEYHVKVLTKIEQLYQKIGLNPREIKNKIISKKTRQNSALIHVGWGGGSWETSLLLLAEDHGIKERYQSAWKFTKYQQGPKTIRVTPANVEKTMWLPLGWCEMVLS